MYQYYALNCPHCQHGDRVQKVSVLVANSTTTGITSGWTVGYAGGRRFHGHTVAWSRQQTVLAGMLAPPRRPFPVVELAAGAAILLLVLFFLCVVSQAATIAAQANLVLFLVWAVFVLLPLVLLALVVRGIRTHAVPGCMAWREWHHQMQKWQALYYCHRCGGVFLPGLLVFVPAAAAKVFLAQP